MEKYNGIYKVINGKLLKIKFQLNNNIIESFNLRGDFFIHPEDELENIEKFLIGLKIDNIDRSLNDFLKKNHIQVLGFNPIDLKKAIKNAMETNN